MWCGYADEKCDVRQKRGSQDTQNSAQRSMPNRKEDEWSAEVFRATLPGRMVHIPLGVGKQVLFTNLRSCVFITAKFSTCTHKEN